MKNIVLVSDFPLNQWADVFDFVIVFEVTSV